MPVKIEVGFKPGMRDPRGEKIKHKITHFSGRAPKEVRVIEVYTIDAPLSSEEAQAAAAGPLSDPIIQNFTINRPLAGKFDWLIEVGFRPGVTDNVGRTAKEAIELLTGRAFKEGEAAYTSVQYAIEGKFSREEIDRIASGLLANVLIQRYAVFSGKDWNPKQGSGVYIPKVRDEATPHVEEVSLDLTPEELIEMSSRRLLALSLEEMQSIQDYLKSHRVLAERKAQGLGAKVTDVELEALAQTWSEHCKHKIFNAFITYFDEHGSRRVVDNIFDKYVRGSTDIIRRNRGADDFCLSVFKDNAGIIRFNNRHNLVFKVETHNSPSALDPYGGALTGIVGVNRDPFGTGLGARLIFNVDTFCFASPFHDRPLPPRLLHPRRIYEGVVEGVEHGGNKSGIPTVNGGLVFDERYLGKPLVFCGTAGIMPASIRGIATEEKHLEVGDQIVMVGGRIGKDGIHGATFSSEELHEGSPATAVQIGDPIVQKRMTDFLLKARDKLIYRAITDNGAGGLSSSVGEMARISGGCRLDLTHAPLKYPGLMPWEILLSEAQERMTLAVAPKKLKQFMELASRMGVESTVVGEFTDTGKFHVVYQGKTVAYLDMEFLHNGLPRMRLTAKWERKSYPEPNLSEPKDLTETLSRLLSHLNISSKESIIRRYDHEVQGGSVIKPLVGAVNDGPSDAAVVRPLLDSREGVVVANGICPRYSDIDTYHMMACAIDEAVRNALAVGGSLDYLAGLDNFCWPDPIQSEKTPDGEYKLAQLVRANMALYDYCTAYGIPCISGKDSMKNDYRIGDTKISIPPTVLFSVIGRIPDVKHTVTMDAKKPGDLVYVLGVTYPELGASEYFAELGFIGNSVPRVNALKAKALYRLLTQAITQGFIASCHDCSDGGLGVALAECAFAGNLGMKIELSAIPSQGISRSDHLLFSESQSRFAVTVPPKKQRDFESLLRSVPFALIGRVTEEPYFVVWGLNNEIIIKGSIQEFKAAWQRPLNF